MKKLMLLGITIASTLVFSSQAFSAMKSLEQVGNKSIGGGNKLIYGADDRQNIVDYKDPRFREYAKSVAGMVKNHKLQKDYSDENSFTFRKTPARETLNLCPGEKFGSEVTLPICTGFLVAKDILVTAGHCVTDKFDCSKYKWVFDYTAGTDKISKDNVYTCKNLLEQNLKSSWFKLKDYAVIQLDREVKGRKPLKIRTKRRATIGTKLAVIGHPSGLPLKIADGAKIKISNWKSLLTPIRTLVRKRNYFTANLDTYAGNSGSPVFNLKEGFVEGILIQGANDYKRVSDLFCNASVKRSNSAFVSEEKVFRITKVPLSKYVKKSVDGKRDPDDTDE